jgi:hypothetical protein
MFPIYEWVQYMGGKQISVAHFFHQQDSLKFEKEIAKQTFLDLAIKG